MHMSIQNCHQAQESEIFRAGFYSFLSAPSPVTLASKNNANTTLPKRFESVTDLTDPVSRLQRDLRMAMVG